MANDRGYHTRLGTDDRYLRDGSTCDQERVNPCMRKSSSDGSDGIRETGRRPGMEVGERLTLCSKRT